MGFSDAGRICAIWRSTISGSDCCDTSDMNAMDGRSMTIERAVHRLTGELADWYDIDAGHLRIGDRADLVIVDPDHLDERLDGDAESPVPQYGGLPRMVNRHDDAGVCGADRRRTVVARRCTTPVLGTSGPVASCAPAAHPGPGGGVCRLMAPTSCWACGAPRRTRTGPR